MSNNPFELTKSATSFERKERHGEVIMDDNNEIEKCLVQQNLNIDSVDELRKTLYNETRKSNPNNISSKKKLLISLGLSIKIVYEIIFAIFLNIHFTTTYVNICYEYYLKWVKINYITLYICFSLNLLSMIFKSTEKEEIRSYVTNFITTLAEIICLIMLMIFYFSDENSNSYNCSHSLYTLVLAFIISYWIGFVMIVIFFVIIYIKITSEDQQNSLNI